MLKKKKTYNCFLCNWDSKLKNKSCLCSKCKLIKEHIIKNGLDSLLNFINDFKKKDNPPLYPSCP
jgi:hypothetical protein